MIVRFLVLLDTHDNAFPNPASLPKADVVLHCGDMTMTGDISNYKNALENPSAIDAELKLDITGNHYVSLDSDWWALNLDDDDDPNEPVKARQLFDDKLYRMSGVHFLDEGTYSFSLRDGRAITVYASPYMPEFNGYAFSYWPNEDRFSLPSASSSIPHNVDVIMTHGPPSLPVENYRLDHVGRGDQHGGCPKLYEAIRRTRPRLHCFGHLHEGYGAQVIQWAEDGQEYLKEVEVANQLTPKSQSYQYIRSRGETETVLLNAAIMTQEGEGEYNKPWLVDLDLLRPSHANQSNQ